MLSRYAKTACHVNENYEKRIQFSGFGIDKGKAGRVPVRKELDLHLECGMGVPPVIAAEAP